MPADLSGDHRDRIGRKPDVLFEIEPGYGFQKPDASDLKQVVRRFAASGKPLYNGQHQTQIRIDKPFPRRIVS